MFDIFKESGIFMVSVPKSGTDYTWNMLSKITGLKIPNFSKIKNFSKHCHGYDFDHGVHCFSDIYSTVLRPEILKKYYKNHVLMTHMGASFTNIEALKKINIKKISFLVRDPKDALISWYYHCEKHHNHQYFSKIYYHPEEYYTWSKEEKINHLIRCYYPIIINQIRSWLNYSLHNENLNIVIFDQLKNDPEKYFKSILKFHNIDKKFNHDLTPKQNKFHFREGKNKTWKEELTKKQITLCNEIVGKDFENLFNNIILKELNGKRENKIFAIVKLLEKYSNSKLLFNLLVDEHKNIKSKNTNKLKNYVKNLNFDDHGNFYHECQRIKQIKEFL